ncbi:hypothetical protein JKP88DRAFT_310040, partial [Tribonema minus]
ITGFDVTFGSALAAAGYHRTTLHDGGTANINRSNDKQGVSSQSFLWYCDVPSKLGPVVDVQVLYDDEPTPPGWEKVPRSMVVSDKRSSHLCLKRAAAGAGTPMNLGSSDGEGDDPAAEDEQPLTEEGDDGVYLWVRRAEPGLAEEWSAHALREGDWVDARDRTSKWMPAQIVAATADAVTVQYKAWAPKWNETIPRASTRLAAPGARTGG